MIRDLDVDAGLLDVGVAEEVGAHQRAVERPVVLRVGRRMDADVPAAGADPGLERGLLVVVEHVTRRQQKHHHLESRQVVGRKLRRILGRLGDVSAGRLQVHQLCDRGRDRFVPEPRGAAEQQHVERRARVAVGRAAAGVGRRVGGSCRLSDRGTQTPARAFAPCCDTPRARARARASGTKPRADTTPDPPRRRREAAPGSRREAT